MNHFFKKNEKQKSSEFSGTGFDGKVIRCIVMLTDKFKVKK